MRLLARLYESRLFSAGVLVLVIVLGVLVSNGNAPGVRAVLELIAIVAVVLLLAAAAAHRHERRSSGR
jgi:archaellum biogenesis protein FlaJ (TadC family)